MTTLSSFFKTDLVDDHVADDVNKLIAAVLRAEYCNTETITATKELNDTDCQFQIITASGADRTVELSPEATTNHVTIIKNAGASNQVIVKDDSGTTVFATLSAGEWAMFLPFGGTVWGRVDSGGDTNTLIDGQQLIWNSATSISVGVGSCYAENGSFIDITSALVKSSLSLSASTWYHVYVYLSAGVPAAEVVTTAPVAWKGTAYSKTGDTSRRYVGSILSDGSSNVRNFQHFPQAGQILYLKFQLDASPYRALTAGTASSATAIALNGIIPVTANAAVMRLVSTADQIAYSSDDNGVSSTQATIVLSAGNTVTQRGFGTHPVDSSQQIWYRLASAPGTGGVSLDVSGYQFNR